jgi:hypothetical protein
LVDWIDTACYNRGVRAALVCTPQLLVRLKRAEEQTAWNADQFRGRVKRFKRLPTKPTPSDLEAVAWKLLPGVSARTIKYLVGYALSSKLHFSAIVDAVDEAKYLTQREGRKDISFDDLERAIRDYCAKSAQAWAAPVNAPLSHPKRRVTAIDNAPYAPVQDEDFSHDRTGITKPLIPAPLAA